MALDSFVVSLFNMAFALLTFLCIQLLDDFFPWWVYVVLCIVVCAFMAWMDYLGKTYGYWFDDSEEESEEENGEE